MIVHYKNNATDKDIWLFMWNANKDTTVSPKSFKQNHHKHNDYICFQRVDVTFNL